MAIFSQNLAECRVETVPSQHPQRILALIEYLHARHVGLHDRGRDVDNLLIEGVGIATLDQHRTGRL